MSVRAVFFDVGETLVDETRNWAMWADYMGVPQLTFFAVLGAVIAQGAHHRDVFRYFQSDFDYELERKKRRQDGEVYEFRESDFYPDALPTLQSLKHEGYVIGIAGNQPEGCEAALREAGVTADILASSALWGFEKPSDKFFEQIIQETGFKPSEIAYVGDRYDNDIVPAQRCGLVAIFIRRGPWALLRRPDKQEDVASAEIEGLAELAGVLEKL